MLQRAVALGAQPPRHPRRHLRRVDLVEERRELPRHVAVARADVQGADQQRPLPARARARASARPACGLRGARVAHGPPEQLLRVRAGQRRTCRRGAAARLCPSRRSDPQRGREAARRSPAARTSPGTARPRPPRGAPTAPRGTAAAQTRPRGTTSPGARRPAPAATAAAAWRAHSSTTPSTLARRAHVCERRAQPRAHCRGCPLLRSQLLAYAHVGFPGGRRHEQRPLPLHHDGWTAR